MLEPVYEVFARKARGEPLRHIGFINAMDPELARISAWSTYDEQKWLEMFVVARETMVPVKLEGSPCIAATPERVAALIHAVGAGSYGGDDVATQDGSS